MIAARSSATKKSEDAAELIFPKSFVIQKAAQTRLLVELNTVIKKTAIH
jgi:hypothetical protein